MCIRDSSYNDGLTWVMTHKETYLQDSSAISTTRSGLCSLCVGASLPSIVSCPLAKPLQHATQLSAHHPPGWLGCLLPTVPRPCRCCHPVRCLLYTSPSPRDS
eukprot:TRINITY_DN56760_c0_g1_i1.p1 TRINITY_DN56760_c0_g1~~TRINITY_DN56760_c0_g1_i1.p1  ORF type:complete len:103 (+),score=15.68 TRINITY_DN56760_c0_g1_i1:93-401(+)